MSEVTSRTAGDDGLQFGETARHAQRRHRGPWGAVLRVVGISLAVLMVSTLTIVGVVANFLNQQVQATVVKISETEGPPPEIGKIEGGFNILIVGSDTRLGQEAVVGGEEAADVDSALNDVNILLHVSEDQTNATAVSFPRDLVVGIPECPDENGDTKYYSTEPLNTALYYGGLQCVVMTIENLTGLPIQFAGMIDFVGVTRMADAVGGVDVCIDAPMYDPNTAIDLPEAGIWHLDGESSLAFLRSRHGVGDGSDLTRISSQQVYLSSLIRKIKSDDTLTDPKKVFALANAALQSMQLSSGLADPYTLASIAFALKDIPLERITFVQYPGTTGGSGVYEGKVQPVQWAADELFAQIASDQPFVLDRVGDDRGSTLAEGASADPATDGVSNEGLPVVSGVNGQTAAQETCSVTNVSD